jgi:hypothetical protein
MDDKTHDLHTFMEQVTSEMASEYERIFAKTTEDPGTAGDEGEENWAQLLREWLPPAYHVTTKGRLIASDGTMSPQIDVLVLKPFYPPKLREKKVWLAKGVAAVFECKTTLRAEHISDSVARCHVFKQLFPHRTGTPARELRLTLIYGILAHSHSWKAPASNPSNNIDRALLQAMEQTSHPADLVDLVCCADVGCWSGMALTRYDASWNPDASAQLAADFGGAWGPTTTMIRSALGDENQHDSFRPIGGMLAYLTQRLAWEDPSIRDLADYYRLVNLWGQGGGPMRNWPQSVLSEKVRRKIESGMVVNGLDWSEWDLVLI